MAKTRTSDQKKPTRQKLLQDFCRAKGWELPNGWDVQSASTFFGKPKNKIGDLLRGQGSFGPQIARDLEEASNGELSLFELDGLEPATHSTADWPFSAQLHATVRQLDRSDVRKAENMLRAHLGLPTLPVIPKGGDLGGSGEDRPIAAAGGSK